MLFPTFLVALATSVASVSAQLTTTTISANVVVAGGSTIICTATGVLNGTATPTITRSVTSTYCPVCDQAKATGGVYTTVFQSAFLAICPTGLTSSTYPVTAVVTGTTPIDHKTVPSGFTTTVAVCTGCPVPSPVTITVPIGLVIPTGPVVAPGPVVTGAPVIAPGPVVTGAPVVVPGSVVPGAPVVLPGSVVPGAPVVLPGSVVPAASVVPGVSVVPTAIAGVTTKITGGAAVTSAPVVFTGGASSLFDPMAAMIGVIGAIFAGMLFL